ncbi:MAG: hypothetical protein R3C19_08720 [Planctomycetaceae bacterium]
MAISAETTYPSTISAIATASEGRTGDKPSTRVHDSQGIIDGVASDGHFRQIGQQIQQQNLLRQQRLEIQKQ